MKRLERHLEHLRACFAELPDPRRGRNRRYAMADVAMAALSVFFMQSPSFLAHQRALAEAHTRSNAHTLFGLSRIPCDNHIRQLLDGLPTAHFDACFYHIVDDLLAHRALTPMRRLDQRVLIALDGTEFFRSRNIHCNHCSTRKRSDGATEHFHPMLAATVVAPGHARTLPLPPAFIQPRDGAKKQDCELQAAKRWLQHHGPRCARSTSATRCTPASPSARPCSTAAGRFCSPPSPTATRPSTPISRASSCPPTAPPRAKARDGASTATAG